MRTGSERSGDGLRRYEEAYRIPRLTDSSFQYQVLTLKYCLGYKILYSLHIAFHIHYVISYHHPVGELRILFPLLHKGYLVSKIIRKLHKPAVTLIVCFFSV